MKTLEEHLAAAYDRYVHGRLAWKPADLAADMAAEPTMETAVKKKLQELDATMRARRDGCFVTKTQQRALRDALDVFNATKSV